MPDHTIEGSIAAIVTPFCDEQVDERALVELIETQIDEGTHGIVPCGTTGESPTLSHKEHMRVIEVTVKTVDGRIPVIAGTGSNSTAEAIALTQYAEKVGADAALIVVPYYNKPTQEGLYRHFKAIAQECGIPLIIYNIPGRSGVNITPETVARLASDCKSIIGIKEASGSVQQAADIIALTGDGFTLLSGEDSLNYPILALGGKGFISVTANVLPADLSQLYNLYKAGEHEKAKELYLRLHSINKALFIETNPIPVKTALALMGKITDELRLPLCQMSSPNKARLIETLKSYGLIG